MKQYPDLLTSGYKVDAELGRNRTEGRITWKGVNLANQETVVIKQFCFAVAGSTWSGYQACEQEIKILKQLQHPQIPKYLDSIETDNGFCLVQEYISASNLSEFRQLSISEALWVADNVLAILIYFQQQNPPILHRDLKLENILLNENLQVFLIDFGLATIGTKELSGSDVFKGTPGFIAPEQLICPTLASDIYSLGITLVCLLARKNIGEISKFTNPDNPYQLKLRALLPQLDRQLLRWLGKMTHPQVGKRFADAATAQAALSSLVKDLNLNLDVSSDPSEDSTEYNLAKQNSSSLFPELEVKALHSEHFGQVFKPPLLAGTAGIFSLAAIAIWSVNFIAQRGELSFAAMAIAVVGAIAFVTTQFGAVVVVTSEPPAKIQGGIIAIAVPVSLAILSVIFWGISFALNIAVAITIADFFILAYFWWQMPVWSTINYPVKVAWLSGAVLLGWAFGIKLIGL